MAVLPFYKGNASVWDGNLSVPCPFPGPGISGDWSVRGGIRHQSALLGPPRNPSAGSREEMSFLTQLALTSFSGCGPVALGVPVTQLPCQGWLPCSWLAIPSEGKLLLGLSEQGFGGLSSSFKAGPHTELSLPAAPPLSEGREG